MSFSYLLLIVVSTAIGLGAQAYVRSQINKYQNVPTLSGLSGREMGQEMLNANGIGSVPIHRGGPDMDHFDPTNNSITLDPHAYEARSVTAIATACHEVGHAAQFAQGFGPMRLRSAIFPVVNLASNAWMIVLLIGFAMNLAGLVDLAIILFSFVVLFQLVTLPVEFDASRRALVYLKERGLVAGEQEGAARVLRACALTYVAAALVSALQLLWLLGQRND